MQPKGFATNQGGKKHPVFEKKGIKESDLKISVKGNNDTIVVGKSKEKSKFVQINKDNVNDIEATEITLGVLSDGEFYRKVINPESKNIAKRMLRSDFTKEHMFTKKSFLDYLGKSAIDTYEKEFGNPDDPMRINPDTRRMIGRNIAEKIFDNARDMVRIEGSGKRKFLVERKTGYRDEYVQSKQNIEDAMRAL